MSKEMSQKRSGNKDQHLNQEAKERGTRHFQDGVPAKSMDMQKFNSRTKTACQPSYLLKTVRC